jgi:hypothetical protein
MRSCIIWDFETFRDECKQVEVWLWKGWLWLFVDCKESLGNPGGWSICDKDWWRVGGRVYFGRGQGVFWTITILTILHFFPKIQIFKPVS